MANEIRVQTSCQIIQDNDQTVEGITYTDKKLDGNADSRSWGGSYTINQAPADDAIAYWKNVVVDVTSADGLENGNAFEDNVAVTDGTLPTTAHVIAVDFVSMLGTDTTISITVSAEILAVLDPGQSVVIPLEMGEAIADCKIHAGHYTDGSREATVNVMVAGV
mgnify:FL=1|jgi:hypothetical protein|tara:strand:- start:32 stop:523 length:492 start_codon:yes stop_codon:yes gene_type:complete